MDMVLLLEESSPISVALYQSGLYGIVARRKPLLSKRHMRARLEFAKRHLKDSQTMRNKTLRSDETKIELFGLNAKRHVWRKPGTGQYNLYGEAWWWQLHAVENISAAGTGRQVRIEGKMNGAKYLEIPVSRSSYWGEGSPSDRAMTLSKSGPTRART